MTDVQKDHEEERVIGGVASSVVPPYHLIPTVALERLAKIFEYGTNKKGDGSWNACSNNQDCLQNIDLMVERIDHVINHALSLRDKLVHVKKEINQDKYNPMETAEKLETDDAAAIAWGGVFLICATETLK